jgi:hypothetical protein
MTVPPTLDAAKKERPSRKRLAVYALLGLVGLFLVIQLVPYGRDHQNPPVTQAAVFKSPKAQQLVADSCNDCHSNLTKWPWYTNVAPASWLVMNDVEEGRGIMNMSEWDKPQPALDEVVEKIQSGEMPPLKYKAMPNHANARLSGKDKAALIAGFRQVYTDQPPVAIRQGGGG